MAVGKARPDQPQQNLVQQVVTSQPLGTSTDIARRELTEPEPKTVGQVRAEGTAPPTGEEIHGLARQKSADTAEGKAAGVKPQDQPKTGQELLDEVKERRQQALEEEKKRAEAIRQQQEEVKKLQEKEQAERQKAADEMRKQAEKQQADAEKQVQEKGTAHPLKADDQPKTQPAQTKKNEAPAESPPPADKK